MLRIVRKVGRKRRRQGDAGNDEDEEEDLFEEDEDDEDEEDEDEDEDEGEEEEDDDEQKEEEDQKFADEDAQEEKGNPIALQSQRTDVQKSEDNHGEEDDDDDDDAADDDEMFRMDERLSAMFKSAKDQNDRSKSKEEALNHFKFRVLALLEIYVKRVPTSPHLPQLAIPLLK